VDMRRIMRVGVLVSVPVFLMTMVSLSAVRSEMADAAMAGDKTAVRTLLQQRSDVNAPQPDGATALHWAAYRDDRELAEMLLRAGANPKAANREGATPLWLARNPTSRCRSEELR
jgi:ankyrin repeat protein